MKVKIKLFDQSLPVPKYQTDGAAAFDLYSRTALTIQPQQVEYAPLNIALQLPPRHWALLAARSSLHKQGLMLANGIGVGDYDYRGDDDEYQAALLNFTSEPATVDKGQRIAQMVILPYQQAELVTVSEFGQESRGGFGSTGVKAGIEGRK
jgi:dUTP pyrophosphatase